MPKCDHCGDEFDGEKKYLKHLKNEHYSELGRIEKRKVDDQFGSGDSGNILLYAGGVVIVLAVIGLLYLTVFSGSGSSNGSGEPGQITYPEPHSPGSVHYHGQITVEINGNQIDFSRSKFQLQDDHFHFENRDGSQWHVHSQRVTLGYAMHTLGFVLDRGLVSYNGNVYRDSTPGVDVTIQVNGKSVDPKNYVLKRGDTIRIIVEDDTS